MAGSIYTKLELINSNTANIFLSAGPKNIFYHIYGPRAESISGNAKQPYHGITTIYIFVVNEVEL